MLDKNRARPADAGAAASESSAALASRPDANAHADLRAALKTIARFLGRPSSDTVIFSGLPWKAEDEIGLDDIEMVAHRLGLKLHEVPQRRFRTGDFDLPALILLENGSAIPILEETAEGGYVTSLGADLSPAASLDIGALPLSSIRLVATLAPVYENAGLESGAGTAAQIEQPHWLRDTLAPFWRSYLHVALAAVFINLIALVSPLFVMNVYDRVLPNEAMSTLWVLALGVSLALLFDLVLKTVRSSLIDYTGRRADFKLASKLFEKIMHSSLASRPLSTGEYASRITQYEFVREFFTSNTVAVLIDSLFVFMFLLVIYLVAGLIFLVPLAALVITLLIGLYVHNRIGKRVAAAANEAALRQSLLVEAISTIETIKSLRAEGALLRRWQDLTRKSARTSEEIKELSALAANATQFVQQMVSVAIILIGAYLFAEGQLSMGAIIASVMLSGRAVSPLGQIAMTLARLKHATLSLRILDTIMRQPEDRPTTAGFVNRQIGSGALKLEDLGFAYPGTEHPVLSGITLGINPGERVGIIGRIGSGKTTLGRLIGGLYAPTQGRLLIDGIDVRQYHPAEVRTAVSVAGQGAELFSGTVKENLLYGNPLASDEELIEVAGMTGVEDFVSRHPRGFDMPVGERGNALSGGQKQALTIARLLLSKPKIVFLDEPSGTMDLATERLLIERLKRVFGPEVTVLVSTHRFSMLELVDRLIVLDSGRVVADGPKDKVLAALNASRQKVES